MNRIVASAAASCLLLLVGCGDGAATSTTAPESSNAPAPSSSADDMTPAGDRVDLAVTAPAVIGEDIDLSEYEGQDLALWFWAPW